VGQAVPGADEAGAPEEDEEVRGEAVQGGSRAVGCEPATLPRHLAPLLLVSPDARSTSEPGGGKAVCATPGLAGAEAGRAAGSDPLALSPPRTTVTLTESEVLAPAARASSGSKARQAGRARARAESQAGAVRTTSSEGARAAPAQSHEKSAAWFMSGTVPRHPWVARNLRTNPGSRRSALPATKPSVPLLIVNADDLGYDPEIDRGILEAHAGGLVTSATAMVDSPFAAAALAAAPRTLGIGLHVVLAPGLAPDAVEAEVRRQAERFLALRGAPPTHLDSHRHAHAAPALLPRFAAAARALGLPARSIDSATRAALRQAGVATSDRFLGDAGLRPCWTRDRLLEALTSLAGAPGAAELMAHPGHPPSHARTSFGAEREVELRSLCDPAAREALRAAGVRLATWAELTGRQGEPSGSGAASSGGG